MVPTRSCTSKRPQSMARSLCIRNEVQNCRLTSFIPTDQTEWRVSLDHEGHKLILTDTDAWHCPIKWSRDIEQAGDSACEVRLVIFNDLWNCRRIHRRILSHQDVSVIQSGWDTTALFHHFCSICRSEMITMEQTDADVDEWISLCRCRLSWEPQLGIRRNRTIMRPWCGAIRSNTSKRSSSMDVEQSNEPSETLGARA